MKFEWIDYVTEMDFVEGWLDEEAVHFTDCDEGWRVFFEYWRDCGEMVLGEDYWCKVICTGGTPVGVVAFSRFEGAFTVMELLVSPEKRGRGIGTAALTELLANGREICGVPITKAKSVIFPDNVASQRAFERAGFKFSGSHPDGDAWYYEYEKKSQV